MKFVPNEENNNLPYFHSLSLSLASRNGSFHRECISKWLSINKMCPICRVDVEKIPTTTTTTTTSSPSQPPLNN
jgi:hypothetical protein